MTRYIDADKLKDKLYNLVDCDGNERLHIDVAIDVIDNEPEADVRENARGEWISVINGRGGFECSKCHEYAPSYQNGDDYLSHYCPNCGAEMSRKER